MRENKANEILKYFKRNPTSKFTLENLSLTFNVSNRQIQNYIRQINIDEEIILKIKDGYYLNPDIETKESSDVTPKQRIEIIISRLLRNNEVNIFDLADELFVSRSSIEADLKKVRKELENFNLKLVMNNDLLTVEGSEKNKRKLSSYMIKNIESKGFSYANSDLFLNNKYDLDMIRENIQRIFDECEFIYNDYSINNILLHLTITIDRLHSGLYIDEKIGNPDSKSKEAALKISNYISKEYRVKLNDNEINNLALFLSCNLATIDCRYINLDYVKKFVDKRSIEIANKIIDSIIDYYYLEKFDDVFMTRFIIHIDNLIKRQEGNYSASNPLHNDIFNAFPLIYDTAVFAANAFKSETGFTLNEDEISLLALHIGSFIETSSVNKNKLTVLYIYADYHGIYQRNILSIQNRFADSVNIKYSISSFDYSKDKNNIDVDLIISEVPIVKAIMISPFINDSEFNKIEKAINEVKSKKSKENFKMDLTSLFGKEMYCHNLEGNNEEELIHNQVKILSKLKIVKSSFEKSVIERERLASTNFVKGVAIPHAIDQCVKQSFIAIANFDVPVKWHNTSVSVVIMIGISYKDRKIFRSVFSNIVKFLEDENNIIRLSKCTTYEEIIKLISE